MPSSLTLGCSFYALFIAVVVASCSGHHAESPHAAAASSAEIEKEVLELDRAWGHAYVTGDFEFVDRLLSPDWQSWTDHNGSNKTTELADFRAGQSKSLENIIDDARVRVYGDAAVVQARERVRFKDLSGEHWLTWRITDVFIRRGNSWQVVATHQSTIPNP